MEQAEIADLCQCLATESSYYAPRLGVEHITVAVKERRVAVRRKDGMVVAFGALWPSADAHWVELGSLWVRKEYRKNGYASEISRELMAAVPKSTRVFSISKYEKLQDMFMRMSMIPATKCHVPEIETWALKVGLGLPPEGRLPKTALSSGPAKPRDKERWLFIEVAYNAVDLYL